MGDAWWLKLTWLIDDIGIGGHILVIVDIDVHRCFWIAVCLIWATRYAAGVNDASEPEAQYGKKNVDAQMTGATCLDGDGKRRKDYG